MKRALKWLFVGELSWKRVLRSLVLIPLVVLLGLLVIAMLFADWVIFRPHDSSYRDGPAIIKLATASGESISASYNVVPSSTYTILYSHGNGEDIGDVEPFLWHLRGAGFSTLAYDYRGYGTSEGSPSEGKAYEDIDAAYRYLTLEQKIPPGRIILHGRSLGGGVAADLAAREPVGGLILESTFTSAFRVVTRWRILPFDQFTTVEKLIDIRCPLLVIHGKRDGVIGFAHGEELFRQAREPKDMFWVEEAGHNDLFWESKDSYLSKIIDFAAGLSQSGPRDDLFAK